MAQAMERLLATPKTIPSFPASMLIKSVVCSGSFELRRGSSRRTFDVDGLDNLLGEFRFFHQRLARGLLTLADEFAVVLQPRALFVHGAALDAHIQDAAFL